MSIVDLIIIGVVILLAVSGFRQGFVVAIFSLSGFAGGIVIATRLVQQFSSEGDRSPYAPLLGFTAAIGLAMMMSTLFEGVAERLRSMMHDSGGAAFDRLLGAALAGGVALLVVWVIAAVVIATPQLRDARPWVLKSTVIARINAVLPPSGPILNLMTRFDPLPGFDGPKILTRMPDPKLSTDPQVRAAAASVVRVVGTACGYEVTGSGWYATPDLVITNAHVVAGEDETSIQLYRGGGTYRASVVHFDPAQDLAVLRIRAHRGVPLRMVAPAANQAGAIIGYPENGPLDTRAARFSDTRQVQSEDIYGQGPVARKVTSFRGLVRHGNSGGPVVSGDGAVLTTVFATAMGGSVTGGYGIPNDVVRHALARKLQPVSAGPCSPG